MDLDSFASRYVQETTGSAGDETIELGSHLGDDKIRSNAKVGCMGRTTSNVSHTGIDLLLLMSYFSRIIRCCIIS